MCRAAGRAGGTLRRFVNRGGSVYARAVLEIPVHDTTSGFKVYRREVLEAIEPARIESRGYAFQIETVYRAIRKGFSVEEVPIRFTDRTVGGSKMGAGIVLEAMTRCPHCASRRRGSSDATPAGA